MQAQSKDTNRGLSAPERHVLDALTAAEHATVTAKNVERLLDVPRLAANQILGRLARNGWLLRVRRGLYWPVPLGAATSRAGIEEPWLVAMAVFSPGYISGWSGGPPCGDGESSAWVSCGSDSAGSSSV